MKLFPRILFVLFFIYIGNAIGQNFHPPIVNYSLKDYGTSRNPENYSIVQDHRGVMYFANAFGVLEFDGESLRDVEWAVFKTRWKDLTGQELKLD